MYCTGDFVTTFDVKGKKVLSVDPRALTLLAEQAFVDVAHLLRPSHLQVKTVICCLKWLLLVIQKCIILQLLCVILMWVLHIFDIIV